jgi:hypothetical protein
MQFTYPENMTREQALTRRANKFIEWLGRDEFAYADDESNMHLSKLIKLIIYALETSLSKEEWQPFLNDLWECRTQLQDVFETDEIARMNYNRVVDSLCSILDAYKTAVSIQLLQRDN